MRLFLFCFLLQFASFKLYSQSYIRFSVGSSVHVNLTNSLIQTDDASPWRKTKMEQYQSQQAFTYNVGATVWAHGFIGKKLTFQGGIGYLDVGYERDQTNIQYLDSLYPGLGTKGIVLEKSSGSGDKSVVYTYHFRYLQIPILFNYEVYHSRDYFYRASITGGVGINVLLNHSMSAHLSNFVVDGKEDFSFDSTGYAPRSLTMNMMLGTKWEYRLNKKP